LAPSRQENELGDEKKEEKKTNIPKGAKPPLIMN
jgi:hypothetical protein